VHAHPQRGPDRSPSGRNGTFIPGFPIEGGGLRGDEVTTGEVLSAAGYATAFFGKGHLGDVEESYLQNQGFPEMLPTNPYKLDEHFLPRGWVMAIEGKKGEPGREWRGTSHEDFPAFDPECEKRALEFIRKNAAAGKPF
jgi:arylsulfatase